MTKYVFIFIASFISYTAAAQVTIWKDTVSYYGVPKNNIDVALYDTIYNNTASAVNLVWSKTAENLLNGWTGTGICDEEVGNAANGVCYPFNSMTPHTINIPANGKATIHLTVNASPSADDGINWISITTNHGPMVFRYINWPTKVNDIEHNNIAALYPNPAGNFIYVNKIDPQISGMNIINIVGTQVQHFDLSANTNPSYITTEQLTPGLYMLQFTNSKGNIIGVKRLSKQ
jgi:hypothetical protein